VKKSQEIFKRHGYEPLALKAHDSRLLIGGYTPKVACRVVAEELLQALIDEVDRERDGDDQIDETPDQTDAINPEYFTLGHVWPQHFTLGHVWPQYAGHSVKVEDKNGTIWYGVFDDDGFARMTRRDLLPTKKGQ
jgi:hypothetical protein